MSKVQEQGSMDASMQMHKKSAVTAFVLSFFLVGVGQIYVGKVVRGVLFFMVTVAIGVGMWFAVAAFFLEHTNLGYPIMDTRLMWSFMEIVIPGIVALLGMWIFQLIDAYRQADKYNAALLRLKRPPFKDEY